MLEFVFSPCVTVQLCQIVAPLSAAAQEKRSQGKFSKIRNKKQTEQKRTVNFDGWN